MKILISLLFFATFYVANASDEIHQARRSINALIDPILRKNALTFSANTQEFTLKDCEKHHIDWKQVLLTGGAATLKYTFAPGCDIEGVLHPVLLRNFTVDLKVKNLQDFDRLLADNKISATFEDRPVLNLAVRNARLMSKKGEIKFDADYAVKLDLTNKVNVVHEDLGGEIRLVEIYGKKVSQKEKFKIDQK